MMKRFVGISLVALLTALIVAACGAAGSQSTTNDPAADVAEEAAPAAETAAEETTAEENAEEPVADVEEDVAGEEAVAGSDADAAAAEPVEEEVVEAVSDISHQNADCTDPFEGASVSFNQNVWSAEQISRFVGEDIVDPASGAETNFCLHSVDYGEIISGGPPPDGIPPIDNPNFDPLAVGDEWLEDVQPVIALEIDGDARAYPLAILTRHEIVNDEVGGMPVAVTFCPLCNAGLVFDRTVDGEVLRFGVSGNLRNSDLIMWDNKTLSWWQQFTGEAIVGEKTGTQLEFVPAQMVSWGDFKAAFPEGQVLSTNGRSYGQNPYTGYDSSTQPFLYLGTPDPRLPALERVLGYSTEGTAVAYPLPEIAEAGVIEDTVDGQDVVIFYAPGQVSALDQGVIANSKEVGSATLYKPEVDGQTLTFSYDDGVITDNETGSTWNIFGQATSGELEGSELEPLLSRVDFWFAWAAFQPETTVYGS